MSVNVILIAPAGVSIAFDQAGNRYAVAADGTMTVPSTVASEFLNHGFEYTAAEIGSISNTNIAAGAAIDYSKLALTASIVNADIGASAAIAKSKLVLTAVPSLLARLRAHGLIAT